MPTGSAGGVSSPEYLHENHWESEQATINAAGVGGQQNLGAAVAAGKKRRIREVTVRHAGTANTVVSLLVGTTIKVSFDVPPQTTRVWSSEDGCEFTGGQQPLVQSSDVAGGNTFVSAGGVEA